MRAAIAACVLVLGCLVIVGRALAPPGSGNGPPGGGGGPPGGGGGPPGHQQPPNILFIIMDDVGIDALSLFNPAAPTPPSTPNIDTIAAGGVMFTNYWAMPECSPARASFFTGRYPLRTGVTNIILDNDLPGGQVSPYETTAPRLMAAAGYTSALIGKFHLGNINPAGSRSPAALGWDYYNGILAGVPPDIDATVGGQVEPGDYDCGFPVGSATTGVCWFNTPSGTPFCDDAAGSGYTGLDCLALGGIPGLDAGGQFATRCAQTVGPPDFSLTNGFYVWPRTTSHANGAVDSVSREYMTVDQTDAAIAWIEQHMTPAGAPRPWMCSVSYNSDHTPYQQPPASLTPDSYQVDDCILQADQQMLSNLMIEAMDEEIARLLVTTGLAVQESGELSLRLEETNTVVIIVGDNGSFYPVVQSPYNPLRAKGTCYTTGVECPLIVAGPGAIVVQPGRAVDSMTNCVDLFQLFGEIAGLDVRQVVPAAHVLDCQPMLAYLLNPDQPAIRACNFAQIGIGLPSPESIAELGPCVLPIVASDGQTVLSCDDILFISEALCDANGGCWYGTPDEPGEAQECYQGPAFPTCCALRNSDQSPSGNLPVVPRQVWTISNGQYKLVKFEQACCVQGEPCSGQPGVFKSTYELYLLDGDAVPDNADDNLLGGVNGACPDSLSGADLDAFNELNQALDDLLASEITCHGDGNLDKQVDIEDFVGVMQNMGVASVFDVNTDGITDDLDLSCVMQNFGLVCTADESGTQCPGMVGACCLGDGTCPVITEDQCVSEGGTYQGDRTSQCCSAPCS